MDVNVFIILFIIIMSGIFWMALLCTDILRVKAKTSALILVFIMCITGAIIDLLDNKVTKSNNIVSYTIPVTAIEEYNKMLRTNTSVIKYKDDTGKTDEITIDDIKYDSDSTFIEIKKRRWGFLYGTENIIHFQNSSNIN